MPVPKAKAGSREINPNNLKSITHEDRLYFSFAKTEYNDYFNVDRTCPNWSADLFETLQKVSSFSLKDIYDGKYTGDTSTVRIHQHEKAKAPPCPFPADIPPDKMYQIRISVNKGGIHGALIDDVFYVVWFDPHHNLYWNKNKGGLQRIRHPAGNCCKDREDENKALRKELKEAKDTISAYEDLFNEQAEKQLSNN